MALIIADRVKETTTTTGTGSWTLAGAMTGFRSFTSVCANTDTCYYAAQAVDSGGKATGAWETGLGTFTTSGAILARSVIASSNSNALVSFTGTVQVWIDVTAAWLKGPQLTEDLKEAAYLTVASAGTTAIGAAKANTLQISGTTTITAFDSVAAGIKRTLWFTGVLTLTHNAAIDCIGAASIVTANGDSGEFVSKGGGNWKMLSWDAVSGRALVGPTSLPAGASTPGALMSGANSLTAAGTNQATALALTSDYNVLTTVASGTGAVLATAAAGKSTFVVNRGANALLLYPATGAAIDGGSANAAITVPVNGIVEVIGISTTAWYSTLFTAINADMVQGNFTTRRNIAAVATGQVDKGTVGTGTVTFDTSASDFQRLQVSGNLTVAFSNWPTSGTEQAVLLKMVNWGSATITMPTINWQLPAGGFTTTFSTYLAAIGRTALQTSGVDWGVFWSDDNGTTVYGKLV